MKKSELMKIIKEEVEVVLTNEEAIEMFDLDPAALLDEMMPSEFDKGDAYGDTEESCAAKGLPWDEAAGKCGTWKTGLEERELTEPEKEKLKSSEEETPKQPFIDQYGKEKGEEVYYATLTKQAKEKA